VSPWRSNESDEGDEGLERHLFARRARALEPAVVPSLASVLQRAEATREARGAHGRVFVAMALAAACMMAAATRIPRTEIRAGAAESIAAEIDASATNVMSSAVAQEAPPGATCSMDDEIFTSEERTCFAPAPLFTPAPAFAAPPPMTLACSSNESCTMTTP
jgi:hypothetical protein